MDKNLEMRRGKGKKNGRRQKKGRRIEKERRKGQWANREPERSRSRGACEKKKMVLSL
jgi:hypothetical protein